MKNALKKPMKRKLGEKTLYLCYAAAIAALYVVLTLVSQLLGLASGMIQLRLSEILCLLPIFMSAAVPGVTIGCFLANLLTGAVWLDILFGPIATLIGALGTRALRRNSFFAAIPPILSNTVIIPFVLAYGYGAEEAIPFMMLTVGIGEILSIGALGGILFHIIKKNVKYFGDR